MRIIKIYVKKRLGGKFILTNHELDYMMYLLENYKLKKIISHNTRTSSLIINVEDTLNSVFLFKNKKNNLVCNYI